MARLTIDLLGPPHIRFAGRALEPRARKVLALLAYLAVEQERAHSRERLADLLWPDADEDAARNNLRVTLADLRRRLGPASDDYLRAERRQVHFLPTSDHTLDVLAYRRLLADVRAHAHADIGGCDACLARLSAAVVVYRGEFLADFTLPDSVPFEEWAAIERERLHQQQLDALDTLTIVHARRGDHAARATYARRQLALEPWREGAHRQLMLALAAGGDRAAALAAYARCRDTLREALGVEPDEETRALAAQIRAGRDGLVAPVAVTPAPRVTAAPLADLPTPLTPFLGRESELARLAAMLADPAGRLVTLVGLGGMGKTRLAVETARLARPSFADGVVFVPLAVVSDPAALPLAIAAAVGVRLRGDDPRGAVPRALRDRQLLLVLDNIEHLLDGADFVTDLLLAAPEVRVLATSREPLDLRGERRVVVGGLALAVDATPAAVAASPAVRLFVAAAQRARADFRLDEDSLHGVLRVCALVEGMPLGLELAAARVDDLPTAAIAAEIARSAGFLAAPWRDAPARQRSLRAVFAWSWQRLSDEERRGLGRFTVFRGGGTRAAAVAVADLEPTALAGLIRKSLLWVEATSVAGERVVMHELLRQLAAEHLDATERAAVEARHAAAYLALAEEAAPELLGADQALWLERLECEHDNLRAALRWALAGGSVEIAARLAGALHWFWFERGHFAEGRAWLERALAVGNGISDAVRARAFNGAGLLARRQGDLIGAEAHLREGLALWRALGDDAGRAFALHHLAHMFGTRGEMATAERLLEESLAVARAAGDRWDTTQALCCLGELLHLADDDERAMPLLEEAIARDRIAGDRHGIANASRLLGLIARRRGDARGAAELFEESAAGFRVLGDRRGLALALGGLGAVALERGEVTQAAAFYRESFAEHRAIADWPGLAAGLQSLATGLARRGAWLRAVRLAATAAALRGEDIAAAGGAEVERLLAEARTHTGESATAAAWALGQAQPTGEAITAVLDYDEASGGRVWPATQPSDLTASTTVPTASVSDLPADPTPLIGREAELAALAALLADPDVRLLTLIGAGGMGKTRLAIAAAREAAAAFPDGVAFIPLAGLIAAAALPAALAAALNVRLAGDDPREAVLRALRELRLLVVLDNFEHLLDGAGFVAEVLAAAPGVRVLATSREPLDLRGEQRFAVGGLAVGVDASAAAAMESAAVRLFAASARRSRPDFHLDAATLPGALRVCALVEGMPLGLELAAARADTLAPDAIAAAIARDADFLAAPWRDAPARQRSLRAVFAWSWRLLRDEERPALRQLAIFRGGCTPAAAADVAGAGPAVALSLTRKSLLRVEGGGTPAERYAIHELLRQFALEHLNAAERAPVEARHAAYYLALAEEAAPELTGPEQTRWLERLDRDLDNLRAAFAWARERGEAGAALRLAGALARFWRERGSPAEGRGWLEAALALPGADAVPAAARARARYGAGILANVQGDQAAAARRLEESIALYRVAGDLVGAGRALNSLGGVAYDQGDLTRAAARYEECLALLRSTDDRGELARTLANLGETLYHLGDLDRASACQEEALVLARRVGRRDVEAYLLGDLGNVAHRRGDYPQAAAFHRQALDLKRALGGRRQLAITLEDLAALASTEGLGERAARLLGAATALRAAIGVPRPVPERRATEQTATAACATLDAAAWAAAFAAGQALPLEAALDEALQGLAGSAGAGDGEVGLIDAWAWDWSPPAPSAATN